MEKAKQIGANTLDIPPDEWNTLGSRATQRARNVEFLDEAIARGDSFRLATPFKESLAKPGFYKEELIYLLQKSYEYVVDVNGEEWLIKVE